MKKLIMSLFIAVIAITSCSKSEETPVDSNFTSVILPKRKISVIAQTKTTSDYTYNGNKLLEINTGNSKEVYTYTGDLITKLEVFNGAVLNKTYIFTYNNDKLTGSIYKYKYTSQVNQTVTIVNSQIRSVYTTNSDGNILIKRFETNDKPNNVEVENESSLLTYTNGNLTKDIESLNGLPFNTTTYEYDNKNTYNKNILGFNKLIIFSQSVNNIIKTKQIKIRNINGVQTSIETTFTNEFKFNTNNYPIESKIANEDGFLFEEYIYE